MSFVVAPLDGAVVQLLQTLAHFSDLRSGPPARLLLTGAGHAVAFADFRQLFVHRLQNTKQRFVKWKRVWSIGDDAFKGLIKQPLA